MREIEILTNFQVQHKELERRWKVWIGVGVVVYQFWLYNLSGSISNNVISSDILLASWSL